MTKRTAMKKMFPLLIFSIIVFSCHHETQQEHDQKIKDQTQKKIDSIAIPYIANEIAELNIGVQYIKNSKLSTSTRYSYLEKLAARFPEYLGRTSDISFFDTTKNRESNYKKYIHDLRTLSMNEMLRKDSIENAVLIDSVVSSKKFDYSVNAQKEYVKQKWNLFAAQEVYKKAIQKQIEAEQALKEANEK